MLMLYRPFGTGIVKVRHYAHQAQASMINPWNNKVAALISDNAEIIKVILRTKQSGLDTRARELYSVQRNIYST